MIEQALLDQASAAALAAGIKILQGHRLAPTDEAHVARLLGYMRPAPGATIVDIGCGFGEVARLMLAQRPDLNFVLVNQNVFQLTFAPPDLPRIQADMHSLPLADAVADIAMFCYTLCHSDSFSLVLAEAARVTRPGGSAFIYDYERLHGDNQLFIERLNARALHAEELAYTAHNVGWDLDEHHIPFGSDAVFRQAYGNDADYDRVFSSIRPVIWILRRHP